MESRYDDKEAERAVRSWGGQYGEHVALRTYTSRLLGADPDLVLHGGGNTSVKAPGRELTGEAVEVLFVKGSGWDLATIEPPGFSPCRLEPLRRLAALDTLSDEDMVRGLRSQMLDPSAPTPSVEALLHALLPARYVDHTHADAVLAVLDQADSEARAQAVWGPDVIFVPYVMPGFVLARAIRELGADFGRASVMALDKHGIFTWGATAKESYERMVRAVTLAERHLAAGVSRPTLIDAPHRLSSDERRSRQLSLTPLIRGALSRAADGQRLLVKWRDDPEVLSLLERDDAEEVSRVGTATPDHVIRIKPFPAWLGDLTSVDPAELPARLDQTLRDYAESYDAYFSRCSAARGREPRRLDRLPRVLLVPGVGAAVVGKTSSEARIAGDVYTHTARVILDASSIGSFRPVSELDLFDVEYWSLEQAKLALTKTKSGPLSRQVALVTGAASGIGKATAAHLLDLGAHVLLTDRDPDRVEQAAQELSAGRASFVAHAACDVTKDADVDAAVEFAVEHFGGLDVVVSNAGTAPSGMLHSDEGDLRLRESLQINLLAHQRVARAAARVMIAQGLGGAILFNASKSAFNQGPEFGPYAIPKAALIALMKQYAVDLGAHGIRTGAVNADRIRTDLFGGGVLEARAKARGVDPDEYFRQNLLRRETLAEDVASAFGHLATAAATTGSVLTVDGGNPAAFPR